MSWVNLKGKLIEDRSAVERGAHTGNPAQIAAQIVRFGQALLGDLDKTRLAEQTHADGEGERQQSLIGADVARGAFTTNVLLARRQGEDVTSLTVLIDCLTAHPPGELLQELAIVSARK